VLHFNGLPIDARTVTDEFVIAGRNLKATVLEQPVIMSTPPVTPTQANPKTNRIGLQVLDYRGGKTTLCAGCGHNAISERIIDAMYDMGVSRSA
jgi:hypothetical protein